MNGDEGLSRRAGDGRAPAVSGFVAPSAAWIWMRKEVGGAFAWLQFTAMPVAELGMVAAGGPAEVAAAGLYLHCVLLPWSLRSN